MLGAIFKHNADMMHNAMCMIVMTCNDAMVRILQALIVNTTTLGSHLLRTVHVVRANSGAGACAMCTMVHINKVIISSLIIHTLQ